MVRLVRAGPRALSMAAKVVRAGGLLIYPTDTVYGLGCDPLNEEAVQRVFEVKGRAGKPFPILASSLEEARRIAIFNDLALRLASAFWPGPLTLVLPKKPTLPSVATCGLPSVGVRVPGHAFTLELIDACGGLLVGTSANRTGHPPPRTVEEALRELGQLVDLAIDGGPAPLGQPSTVLSLVGPRPVVVRAGSLPLGRLEAFLGLKLS